MNDEEFMKEFVLDSRKYFDTRQDIFKCFCKQGVQVEGWLKGEMLYFLDSGIADERIAKFDREVGIGSGRKKVDFVLTIKSESGFQRFWMEIKHWLIGYQKETRWYATSYFADSSSVGIKPDVDKLTNIHEEGAFLLVLTTANPDEEDWSSGIRKFNTKFRPLLVKSLTNPSDFPSSYFLGLLSVSGRV